MLTSWKVAPALAWGNTVVLKPAEDTPASAAIMARLAMEAGLPPGVLNVLHGYGPNSAGAALTEHPAVDRITFTGESATGRVIARAAAANLVPVSLGDPTLRAVSQRGAVRCVRPAPSYQLAVPI